MDILFFALSYNIVEKTQIWVNLFYIFNLLECLTAYKKANGALPERVIFYRDGVGEGQLQYVYATELEDLKVSIQYPPYSYKLKSYYLLCNVLFHVLEISCFRNSNTEKNNYIDIFRRQSNLSMKLIIWIFQHWHLLL